MNNNNVGEVLRPFGPAIAKVTIPREVIEKLNTYVDKIVIDKNKSKELDCGPDLAGNVQQEFSLEKDFMKSSGWAEFLVKNCSLWIQNSVNKKITKFNIINSWIVRQFKNDYNPLHIHGGHVSGVGYLKVPKNLGSFSQEGKDVNTNGFLHLVHGSKHFLCDSTYNIKPKVGDFYFFPNYMLHSVSPFMNSDEERRSISFNATIDEDIYNHYGG
tara:strand:+ start:146 stop:787 length:642 start_codon:yes stop_codon:yes gene_type:complete